MNYIKKILAGLFCTFLTACYCWQPAHEAEQKCIVLKQEVNCAEDNVKAFLPALVPVLEAVFSGQYGNIDTAFLISALEHTGFKFVACSLAALEDDFTTNQNAARADVLKKAHEFFVSWKPIKAKDTNFCFVKEGKKVCH